MIGKTLAHYEVLEKIGAGGMGEVYRARDTKLGRDVALKLLPPEFASNSERLTRFEREARTLAALNHPNVASIFGLEDAGAHPFLVMELVDGEDLSQRIGRGRVPINEAIALAVQIAEGLGAAHRKAIVHRDLKPANIKLRTGGQLKILDFGLARVYWKPPYEEGLPDSTSASTAVTQAGTVLGTAAYMSPEQARGKSVDKRTDIWAFGAILFEMLAGHRAFKGETQSDTLAAVLRAEPNWDRLPAETPPSIHRLLRRCLAKDPQARLQDIGDARFELEDASTLRVPGVSSSSAIRGRGGRLPMSWSASGILVVAFVLALWEPWREPPPIDDSSFRFSLTQSFRADAFDGIANMPYLAMSPDGSQLVYVSAFEGTTALFLRRLDEFNPRRLEGTEGAMGPFFSPDGRRIGFFAQSKLKIITVEGGRHLTLCDAVWARGATWLADGTIIFAGSSSSGLSRISEDGGEPSALTTLDETAGDVTHRWPETLPDGSILFTVRGADEPTFADASIELLSLGTGQSRIILERASHAVWSPTGHLLFNRSGSLMAVSFDADKGKITGSPVQVLDDLPYRALNGASQFSVSSNGVFAYSPKSRPTFLGTIVTLNHEGTVVWRSDEVLALGGMGISWSGADLAAVIKEGNGSDIWIIDLSNGARRKLTFNGASLRPIWSPDGNWIVYATTTGGPLSLYRIATNGSEEPESLVDAKSHQMPQCFSADGSELIYSEEHAERDWDLWALDMESRESRLLIGEAFREGGAHLSRDGHWLAYVSTKTGTSEIYVRPYPALDREWKISDGGGEWPMWGPKGNMIYYRAGSLVMVASVQTDPEFALGDSRGLFEWNYQSGSFYPRFALYPDTDRIVMIDVGKNDLMYEIPIHVTVNWFGELEQMVAAQQ